MVIGLIGNLNNTLSTIARYLDDEGYNIRLYRFSNEPEHFTPEADLFPERLSDKVFVLKHCATYNISDSLYLSQYKKVAEECDFLIASGYGPAFFSKIGVKVDIVIPYGSDIYSLPFFKFSLNLKYLLGNLLFSYYQKKGLRDARYFIMETQSVSTEKKIQAVGLRGQRINMALPMLHQPTYLSTQKIATNSSHFLSEVNALRERYDVLIFHHSRHSWLNPADDNEQKGNDLLFRGVAAFLNENPQISIGVITLEYGPDVDCSKALIAELGIQGNVHWYPKQNRKDLMPGILKSDMVVAELKGGYNLYGTVIEALAMGTLVVQSREKLKYDMYKDGLHPAVVIEDYSSFGEVLREFIKNRGKFMQMATEGQLWYKQSIVDIFVRTITNIIKGNNA